MTDVDGLRITDLSAVEAENFKYRNTQFLTDADHVYEAGIDDRQTAVRRDIWRVRNGDLRRVLKDFPTDEPVREQAALWMHAVAGKHYFSDADHRTAVALLRKLLRNNGIRYTGWDPERVRAVRDDSHRVRRETEPVRLDMLYRRDRLYEVWRRFFEKDEFLPAEGRA